MKDICRRTLERAYLFLDGEILSQQERLEIEVHLQECAPCYERYGINREVQSLIARLRELHACPDGLRSRITSLIQNS